MKLAILADIHGNLPALEAVTRELERLQPDYVVVDGDLINGVPFSSEVIDRIGELDWVVVRGNHEFYLLDLGTARAIPGSDDAERWGQLHWLYDRITPAQAAYLAMLPDDRTFYLPGAQPLRITHGLPGRNRVGLYRSQPDDKIAAELADVHEATFVTAHTHVQIDRHVRWSPEANGELSTHPHGDMHRPTAVIRHWHIINPGSVGLPLNQRTTAQFALLESVDDATERGGWRAQHHEVAYDRRPALESFSTSGMLEAGGPISSLFYWELVSAEPEIIYFYRWAYDRGLDPDRDGLREVFQRYVRESGRAEVIRQTDPLHTRLVG
ncbi:MAG TPA: metallophosphoesterase family protein [Chloroflexi bacterium]|nr:metallophosphoesterase family protein [Chloroflexota bacterium]